MACYNVVKVGNDWSKVAQVDGIPNIDSRRAADALKFHDEIDAAVAKRRKENAPSDGYLSFPVVGVRQPTLQSVALDQGRLRASNAQPDGIDPDLAGGDGTVPRVSATPSELFDQYRETFFVERHGSLQNNAYVLDDVIERLKQMQARRPVRGTFAERIEKRAVISLQVDDLYLPGEAVRIEVAVAERPGGGPVVVKVVPLAPRGAPVTVEFHASDAGTARDIAELPPGQYRIRVASKEGGPHAATPVHDVFEVAGRE
jgi:hypothetical protein